MPHHAWDTGDLDQNWLGYLIPGTTVLRNRVGATTMEALRDAENDLVEVRLLELRERPTLIGARTYDLAHTKAIHRHLFQDVYDWAGELRTVGIEKGGESFCPPANINQPMGHATMRIHELDRLKVVSATDLAHLVAYLYDYVNYAHPFREGNGRTTREFFDQLLAERGTGLDWERTDDIELHSSCHAARAESDLHSLTAMFEKIIDNNPAYDW